MVDKKFVINRIAELCQKHGKSSARISEELGRNPSYIQNICSRGSLPSVMSLLEFCDYFCITPQEFFDPEIEEPVLVHQVIEHIKFLPRDDLQAILHITEKMGENEKKKKPT